VRIAQVAPPWIAVPPKGYGGIEWVVALLADGLAEDGHDVTLFATGDSTTKAKLAFAFQIAPGSDLINDPTLDTIHTLLAYEDPSRFDVYHVHAPFSALSTGLESGVPIVHTLHGSFIPEMRDLYTRVGDRAHFVAISEAQRKEMPELNYAGVVYNGIDIDRYSLRSDKDDFLLFLGRTAPEKGVGRAIETARLTGMPMKLALKIASATEHAEWDRVKDSLPPNVEVLGEIGQEEKAELLARARAVLFPIDWDEPFGLVMTEAMACGTPVIATPRGSVPEVILDGETGFVVSVENYPEEAAGALTRLGEISPERCRTHVSEKFSKEAMVAGYEAIFEKITRG
jgi:glycosyltransferase involved in cell wall biosynthesis